MDSVESKTGRLLVKYNSLSFDSIKNSFTENDVLYGKLRPYLRKYYMPKFNGVCSSEFWVLNSTYLVQNFLYYYISSDSFNFETNKTCGTKMPRAEWSQIIKLEFYYPEIDEQRIIGTFLQLFDRKIDILSNKIETLKKYKEGFTKRLTKTLNTDDIALSNICSITTGKMDANTMNPEGKYKFFTCSREDYFIDTYAFDCEALLVSGNGDVGLTKYYNGKFNAYQRTYVLYNLKKNAKFIKLFIDLQINTIIRKETNKGAMPYIRLTTFNKIMIPNIDPSLEYLISAAIDKIDKKIELLQNHARVLNNIKNNLLDSLFI